MPSRLFSVDPIEPGQHVFVFSKSRNEVFLVYKPAYHEQLQAGHLRGEWYFRPDGDLGVAPVSNGYPTRTEAIAGLNFNLEAETFEMTASG
jgi:hypothetical protein